MPIFWYRGHRKMLFGQKMFPFFYIGTRNIQNRFGSIFWLIKWTRPKIEMDQLEDRILDPREPKIWAGRTLKNSHLYSQELLYISEVIGNILEISSRVPLRISCESLNSIKSERSELICDKAILFRVLSNTQNIENIPRSTVSEDLGKAVPWLWG